MIKKQAKNVLSDLTNKLILSRYWLSLRSVTKNYIRCNLAPEQNGEKVVSTTSEQSHGNSIIEVDGEFCKILIAVKIQRHDFLVPKTLTHEWLLIPPIPSLGNHPKLIANEIEMNSKICYLKTGSNKSLRS